MRGGTCTELFEISHRSGHGVLPSSSLFLPDAINIIMDLNTSIGKFGLLVPSANFDYFNYHFNLFYVD